MDSGAILSDVGESFIEPAGGFREWIQTGKTPHRHIAQRLSIALSSTSRARTSS
jgi:hypothetical protein